MERLILPYKEIKKFINEGDVLLFRGQGWISRIISSQTDSSYSHVAVASWSNGDANTDEGLLECVEFREGYGGRTVNLEVEVDKHSGLIDVYRPIPTFTTMIFNPETKEVKTFQKDFAGKPVTRIMRKMTGLPYGWKRIWWMVKQKLVFFRFMSKEHLMNDRLGVIIYPVCSTAVAHSFNMNAFDLLNNKSDEATEPGHIALSPRIQYLFTLVGEKHNE
jgi:hypothetical protein